MSNWERRDVPRKTDNRYSSRYGTKQPKPRPKPKQPQPQLANLKPTEPRSGKDRRRMLKAAVWRLSKKVHLGSSDILKSDDLGVLVSKQANASEVGVSHLVNKIIRLKQKG